MGNIWQVLFCLPQTAIVLSTGKRKIVVTGINEAYTTKMYRWSQRLKYTAQGKDKIEESI